MRGLMSYPLGYAALTLGFTVPCRWHWVSIHLCVFGRESFLLCCLTSIIWGIRELVLKTFENGKIYLIFSGFFSCILQFTMLMYG